VLIGALGIFSSSNIFTDFGWVLFRARSRRASSPSVIGCSGCIRSVAAALPAAVCSGTEDRDEAEVEEAGDAGTGDDAFFATA
jgi:hypothetical protein